MALSAEEQAARAFRRGVKRYGWQRAVEWFRGAGAPCRPDVAAAVLAQAIRENLEGIHIGPRALTNNRRRPGVFE